MKAPESLHGAQRPAHAGASAQSAAGAAAGADGAGDAFAALLDGLCPAGDESLMPATTTGAELLAAEEGATPAKRSRIAADSPTDLAGLFAAWPASQALMPAALAPATAPAAGSARPGAARVDAGQDSQAADLFQLQADTTSLAATPAAKATTGDFQSMLGALSAATPQSAQADAAALPTLDLAAIAPHAAASAAHAGTDAATPATTIHQAALPSTPLEAAFAGDVGTEVRYMLEAGLQQAELHLNPAELGPIHIQLSLQAQSADISFAAAHATTREGLQQALPALREMLAGQGLQLGQAAVSADSGRQFAQDQRSQPPEERRSEAPGGGGGPVRTVGTATIRAARGMLDLYA